MFSSNIMAKKIDFGMRLFHYYLGHYTSETFIFKI